MNGKVNDIVVLTVNLPGVIHCVSKATEDASSETLTANLTTAINMSFELYLKLTEMRRAVEHEKQLSLSQAAERSVTSYLQQVDLDRGLSAEQAKQIQKGPSEDALRISRRNARQRILETIKNDHDRRAKITVTFCEDDKSYLMEIVRITGTRETHRIPAWDHYGIKGKIDSSNRPKVPWTQIKSGTPWIADIELSPYFLEDTWTPQNVIPFKNSLQ